LNPVLLFVGICAGGAGHGSSQLWYLALGSCFLFNLTLLNTVVASFSLRKLNKKRATLFYILLTLFLAYAGLSFWVGLNPGKIWSNHSDDSWKIVKKNRWNLLKACRRLFGCIGLADNVWLSYLDRLTSLFWWRVSSRRQFFPLPWCWRGTWRFCSGVRNSVHFDHLSCCVSSSWQWSWRDSFWYLAIEILRWDQSMPLCKRSPLWACMVPSACCYWLSSRDCAGSCENEWPELVYLSKPHLLDSKLLD